MQPPSEPRSKARPTGTSSVPASDAQSASAVAKTAISLEYASLRYRGHCPLGMYITPSPDNLLVWDGVFFVHVRYYTDAILKFRLLFPTNYPDRPPKVVFITDVFHPLVSQQNGSFNLAPRFRPWRPKEHHVFDVLHWIKASFKKHALDKLTEEDCFNKEAHRYNDSTSSFAALATQSSMLSQSPSALFDHDHPSLAGRGRHTMTFRDLKPEEVSTLQSRVGLRPWNEDSS
ncbi:UBC-like protein [Gloeophyllum trabeum ATCC 11539]|uniref:UBC-like protein n=1 Tax=Gloeophyllum trabeum (strain ATCC 11539 / FP-39264 / Madison 617) TaxID=670483 RepID=S7S0G9_GLOTA|nr:UBC-like protein [Gloeophyllum trabeum ATCC 11539]EPQ59219.1 UBC-like protein [Gloeophyllum trabeum ATCC 11539]